MKRGRAGVTCTILIIISLVAGATAAQQVVTRRFDAATSLFIHELTAVAGATEEDATLRFLDAPPAAATASPSTPSAQEGDLIVMAAGKRVRTLDELRAVYEGTPLGEELKLALRRGEQRFFVSFTRAEQPQGGVTTSAGGQVRMVQIGGPGDHSGPMEVVAELGLVLTESDGKVQVLTTLALPGAEPGELTEGDTLVSLDGAAIESLPSFLEAYRALKVGATVVLEVEREGARRTLELQKPAPMEGKVMMRGAK